MQFAAMAGPLLTYEPVLTEAIFLISRGGGDLEALWSFLRRGTIKIEFGLDAEFESVAALMRHYSDVPMDIAAGYMVRRLPPMKKTRLSRFVSSAGDNRITGLQLPKLF